MAKKKQKIVEKIKKEESNTHKEEKAKEKNKEEAFLDEQIQRPKITDLGRLPNSNQTN